jgi:uncharacterized protein YlzI (FlbEa/FlbD family)
MSYINPKAAPINTGAAVYQGIQKLAGDVYTFAKEEQTRKGQLISESLAAQQAIDDNVNKMGLSLEEGEDNFEKQIFEQAQAAKQKIAAQYDAMSRTFSSPEQRAKAKAEINKLNKYPEELVADLSTGKYLVDQFNQGLLVEQGQTGSISKTNNLDLLEVIKDMKGGGKNTKMETNAAGARTLVTNVNGKSYKLNISNITNGLKTNPKQMIFNTVSDDSSITKNYQTAMGISGNIDLAALASEGIISKTSKETFAGKPYEIYTINKDALNQRASALSKSLVDDPQNYNYANSIWQDKLGNSVSLREALGERGADNKYKNQEAVLNQIRAHYVDQAIEASGLNKAISAQMPKPEKPEKAGRYETDKLLETLAENPETEITVAGKKYKIFKKGNKEYIQRQKVVMIYPQKSVKGVIMDDTEKEGKPGYKYDTDDLIPLRNKNNKLNYKYFRSLTEDIQRK